MDADNDNFTPIYGPHPPTQKMAIAIGSKYYFTGKACGRGHIAPRYSSGGCTACHELHRINNREKNRIEAREWRLNNPEKTKAHAKKKAESGYGKQYYERNREREIAKAMAWNAANPERAKESMRRYVENHREELRENKRKKRLENIEAEKERERLWRSQRRSELAEASRLWRQENPEKQRIIDRNKKLRRRGAEGTHTLEDVEKLLKAQKFLCAECSKGVKEEYHVDHIMPLSLGGSNWPRNLQILCPACNMEKHATDPLVFARRKGRLI
jgi:5-methylcytosine-specific restriction endonuclease McrA